MSRRRDRKSGPQRRVSPRNRRLLLVLAAAAGVGLAAFAVSIGIGMSLENNSSFCASCHTQPEQTYVQRMQQPAAADLAAFHAGKQVRCIDCHSGNGLTGRVYAVLAFGVSDTLAFYSGRYHNPAVTTRPLGSDSCIKCHDPSQLMAQGGAGGEGGQGHYHNPQLEQLWQQAGGPVNPCATCHPAHPQIGDASTIYSSDSTAQQGCDSCHGTLSRG